MEGEQLIRAWLDAVDRIGPNEYRPAGPFEGLPDEVRGNSTMWCERFFAPAANPHAQPAPPQRSYHLSTGNSPDLLRHVYTVRQVALDVVESVNFTLIRTSRKPPLAPQGVREVAKTILNLKDAEHSWTFRLPDAVVEGTWFSSDPDADPMAMSWTDRADGGVRKGALVFLCFKKDAERVGYGDIRKWFDAGFRSGAKTP